MKMFLVGPPSVGKSTTLSRFRYDFVNISTGGDEAKCQSSLLANCTQALSIVNKDAVKWCCSKNLQDEAGMLFQYLNGIQRNEDSTNSKQSSKVEFTHQSLASRSESVSKPVIEDQTLSNKTNFDVKKRKLKSTKDIKNTIGEKLEAIIRSGNFEQVFDMLEDATLLNISDIGGQPGFLEMLLSRIAKLYHKILLRTSLKTLQWPSK